MRATSVVVMLARMRSDLEPQSDGILQQYYISRDVHLKIHLIALLLLLLLLLLRFHMRVRA
jgi:hypothetical protein